MKFTIKQFNEKYPDDTACLQAIFNLRYGHLKDCPKCKKATNFYPYKTRKAFACQWCGHGIYPLAGTIFHKSKTSLKDWFWAIYLFSTSKHGVAAKELQQKLGVTYKCAWRMGKQIRTLFKENQIPFYGTVEADETYIGGNKHDGTRGRGTKKTPVFGMVERGGRVQAKVVKGVDRYTLMSELKKQVKPGTKLMTDEWPSYSTASQFFKHSTIKHKIKRYVDGDVSTNAIEGFWSQLKRSIDGTHHVVSPKYLQSYVDEFAFRYNRRFSEVPVFDDLIGQALLHVE